jgi:hypothetical protein
MDDIANLGIRVDSRSVRTADKDLDKLTKASSRAERATDSLKRGYVAATASLIAGAAAIGGTVNKLVQVERQTGILVSSLRTVTGSAALAADAFDALQGLAGRLPVSIPEITDSFIKMKALGLQPTEAALISFTNTASAMGKNLNQFIEAVADASTGEFERLKEFGIKASQSAEGVAFTFQGVTTKVGKNSAEITSYLQRIGEVEFAGAAAARMETLDGQISNLSDSWDGLFRTINERGAAQVITDTVKTATAAIQELNAFIGSGQFSGGLENIGKMFSESFDVSSVTNDVRNEFGATFGALGFAGGETATFIIDAFAKWPRNVAAFVKIIGVEIANLVAMAELYGAELVKHLDPRTWFDQSASDELVDTKERITEITTSLKNLAAGAERSKAPMVGLRSELDKLIARESELNAEIAAGAADAETFAAREQDLAAIRLRGIDEILVGLNDQLKTDEDRATALEAIRKEYDKQKASVKSLDDVLSKIPKSVDKISDKVEQTAEAITDLGAPAGVATGEEFSDGFSRGAERIATTLQDSIASGDWAGLGMTVAGALAGGIGGAVADQLASQLGSGVGASILGPIGGAIAGGLIGLAANAVADFFHDDWDPTASLQAAQGTGTVLGSIEAKSESIRNAAEAIEKTNADLVNINTGMLAALKSVQQGISGATAMIAGGRSGMGFTTPAVEGNFFSSGAGGSIAGGAAGSALAGLLTGGIGAALGGIGGALGNAASGFMDVLTLGLFSKLGSALGGKSRQVDEGIDIIGGTLAELIDDTIVSAYSTFRVKKNAFSSTRTVEQSRLLGEELSNQFGLVFNDILSSVVAGGAALGIDQAALESQLSGFVVENQRLSLEGLDAAAQQAEIAAVFGKLFDDLVMTAVPFLGDFQRAGEGLGETLARVSTEVALAKEAAASLGFAFAGAVTPVEMVAAAADELVMMAGGIEAFSNAMRTFEGAFLSTEEQTALASRRLTEALGELPLPETREGFRALVESQDALTESGRQNIATLLSLAGTADGYYSALETAAEKLTIDAERAAAEAERAAAAEVAAAERAAAEVERLAEAAAREATQAAENAAREIARIFAELQRAADNTLAALRAGISAQVSALEAQRSTYTTGLATATSTTDSIMSQLTGIVDGQRDAAATRLQVEQDAANAERDARVAAAETALSAQRDAINAEMGLRLEANGLMLDAARTMVSEVGRELSGISGALKGLSADVSPEGVRSRAMATLRNALSTGNLTGAGEAAGVATNIDSGQFSNAVDLRRVQGTTAALLSQLEDVGSKQLTDAEQTVAALTAQNDVIRVSSSAQVAAAEMGAAATVATADRVAQEKLLAAQEQHDTEVERLDGIIANAEEYIRVSRGIEAGIMTVDEAIRLGLASLQSEAENRGALEQGKFDEQIAGLNGIYDTAQEQLNVLRGINVGIRDIAGLRASFDAALAAEAAALSASGVNVPGFASGGDFGGGARVVGERGPELEFTGPSRIVDSSSFAKMLDMGELLAEMRALRNDLQAGQVTIAKNTGKTARQLERWDLQGLPEERVFA